VRIGSQQRVLERVFCILMIPNDAEYLRLGYSRVPPTQFRKCLLISALCGGDQITIRDFSVTTPTIPIVRSKSVLFVCLTTHFLALLEHSRLRRPVGNTPPALYEDFGSLIRTTVKVLTPCAGCTVTPPMSPEPDGPVVNRLLALNEAYCHNLPCQGGPAD